MTNAFTTIDHVQLAMPPSQEDRARAFYVDALGMTEIPKPADLAGRGGCWFASGTVQLHLGVEPDFRPAKKAHPGLRCANYDALLSKLRANAIEVREADIPEGRRAFVDDPFGNRIELIA